MKYDVKFCRCGRIHAYENKDLWDFLQDDYKNRRVLTVCTHCGSTRLMWLDEYLDEGLAQNSTDINEGIVPNVDKVIADRGIIIYTMSGAPVDEYIAGYFVNREEWKKDQDKYRNLEEAYDNKAPWATVDTERLIKDVKRIYGSNADEVLKRVSGYVTKINWKGTNYEHCWDRD